MLDAEVVPVPVLVLLDADASASVEVVLVLDVEIDAVCHTLYIKTSMQSTVSAVITSYHRLSTAINGSQQRPTIQSPQSLLCPHECSCLACGASEVLWWIGDQLR